MKTIRVLDSSGDRAIVFDDSEAGAPARAKAQKVFEHMLAKGATAFNVNRGEGRVDEKVTEFSAIENETVVVPRVTGG